MSPPSRAPAAAAAPGRRLLALALAIGVATAAFVAPRLAAAPPERELEVRVKAAYLLNFARYVRWPAAAFSDPEAPIVIGILGDDPFGAILDETVRGKTADGRPIEVRRYDRLEEVRRCQILFLGRAEEDRQAEVLRALRRLPLLTVGESRRFLDDGGGVNLVIWEDAVRFEVNLEVTRAAGLEISSHMLSLARRVVYEPAEGR